MYFAFYLLSICFARAILPCGWLNPLGKVPPLCIDQCTVGVSEGRCEGPLDGRGLEAADAVKVSRSAEPSEISQLMVAKRLAIRASSKPGNRYIVRLSWSG